MNSRVEELPTSSDSDDDAPVCMAATPAPSGAEGGSDATASEVDIARCGEMKVKGNALFSSGDIQGALETYLDALRYARKKPLPPPPSFDRKPPQPATSHVGETAGAGDAAAPSAPISKEEEQDDPSIVNDYVLTSQLMCNAAACLLKQEKYAEAEVHLSEAIRHNPQYERAFLRRAECYYALEKWSSAHADWDTATTKFHAKLDYATSLKRDEAKRKTDEEMKKMLGQLKDLGNMFLGKFGLSTDNFKFDKDPTSGNYSMRFEQQQQQQ